MSQVDAMKLSSLDCNTCSMVAVLCYWITQMRIKPRCAPQNFHFGMIGKYNNSLLNVHLCIGVTSVNYFDFRFKQQSNDVNCFEIFH